MTYPFQEKVERLGREAHEAWAHWRSLKTEREYLFRDPELSVEENVARYIDIYGPVSMDDILDMFMSLKDKNLRTIIWKLVEAGRVSFDMNWRLVKNESRHQG